MIPNYGQLIKAQIITCCACGYSEIYTGDKPGTTAPKVTAIRYFRDQRGWSQNYIGAWICQRCSSDLRNGASLDRHAIRDKIRQNLRNWKPAKNENMVRNRKP